MAHEAQLGRQRFEELLRRHALRTSWTASLTITPGEPHRGGDLDAGRRPRLEDRHAARDGGGHQIDQDEYDQNLCAYRAANHSRSARGCATGRRWIVAFHVCPNGFLPEPCVFASSFFRHNIRSPPSPCRATRCAVDAPGCGLTRPGALDGRNKIAPKGGSPQIVRSPHIFRHAGRHRRGAAASFAQTEKETWPSTPALEPS